MSFGNPPFRSLSEIQKNVQKSCACLRIIVLSNVFKTLYKEEKRGNILQNRYREVDEKKDLIDNYQQNLSTIKAIDKYVFSS